MEIISNQNFIKDNFVYVIYSHSSFSDVLKIQNDYLLINNIIEEKILFIDKLDSNIKYNFDKIIYYDDKLNYSKRLFKCLTELNTNKYIILVHDNDIIIKKSDIDLNNLTNYMKKYNIDRIDLTHRNRINSSNLIFFNNEINLIKNTDITFYIYNVNPSIYNPEKLIKLMNNFDCDYRTIEHVVQKYTLDNLNTYYIYSHSPIHGGYFEVTNIFTHLHITHGGELLPIDNNINNLEQHLQNEYVNIINKYKFNRKIKYKLH